MRNGGRSFARPIDLDGLDRPRSDWRAGPVFRFILKLEGNDAAQLHATFRSLRGQVYPRWSLCAITEAKPRSPVLSAFRHQAAGDTRFSEMPLRLEPSKPKRECLMDIDFVALINSGDCLPDYALAVVAETLAQYPELELIYSDEDCVAPNGGVEVSHSKAGLEPGAPVTARLCWASDVGAIALHDARCDCASSWPTKTQRSTTLAREIPRSAIRHIRRILYHRQSPAAGCPVRTPVQGGARNRWE